MEPWNNQSWILPRLAEFLRTHWPNEEGGVATYGAGRALYETYTTTYVADGIPTDPAKREREVDKWGVRIKRLMERAEAASKGELFERDGLEEILQAARIWVCGADALRGPGGRTRACPPPPSSWSDREESDPSIADLMTLLSEAKEENADDAITIEGYSGLVAILPTEGDITVEQVQDWLKARGEEQDWIHEALETLDPSLAWQERIETLIPLELEIMLADEAPPPVPWARLTVRRTPTLRDSPAVLKMVRDHRDKWAEKGYPELDVIRVLCWALAPLCHTWHSMNEGEPGSQVARLLKAAGGTLAAEEKAHNRPDLVPYHAPLNSDRPLSEEEIKRGLIEEDEDHEAMLIELGERAAPEPVQVSTPYGQVSVSGSSVLTLKAKWGERSISRERVDANPEGIEGVARDWAEKSKKRISSEASTPTR